MFEFRPKYIPNIIIKKPEVFFMKKYCLCISNQIWLWYYEKLANQEMWQYNVLNHCYTIRQTIF